MLFRSASVFSPDVGASILNLLENDHLADGPRKTSRLQTLLNEDKALLGDLVSIMDVNESRNFARRLLDCPVFGDLEKKSLMARIIKMRPETAELVSGEGTKKREEPLLVSWESLERRKNEYREMVEKKIPANSKEIAIARSYGDLRENHEYKAAKEMQKLLMRRKADLETQLVRARGTDFVGSRTDVAGIGTIVHTTDLTTNQQEQFIVLGAWDSEPEKGVVSYLSPVAQAVLNHKIGDEVEFELHGVLHRHRLDAIQAFIPPAAVPAPAASAPQG